MYIWCIFYLKLKELVKSPETNALRKEYKGYLLILHTYWITWLFLSIIIPEYEKIKNGCKQDKIVSLFFYGIAVVLFLIPCSSHNYFHIIIFEIYI